MTTQPERKSCLVCGKSCKVGKKDGLLSSHGFRQMGFSNNSASACIGSYMHWTETLNDLADKFDAKAVWFDERPEYDGKRAEQLRHTASRLREMAARR